MEKIYVGYDCLKCFVSQIDKILISLNLEEEERKKFFLNSINFLSNIKNFKCHPPEIARILYGFLYTLLGNSDPFKQIKDNTNKIAQQVIEALEKDREKIFLEDYLKYAVAGNIIDFGIAGNKGEYNISEILNIIENFYFEINDFQLFYNDLKNCKNLLYILDNSGEAIFDLKFIEKIKYKFSDINVVVAGRSQNIINDISYIDAKNLGFDKYAKVISSGYGGPGICLEQCSSEFLTYFNNADIIISKGQGNFETLWGENKNIYFALKIKCQHVANKSGFKLNSNLFINSLKYD